MIVFCLCKDLKEISFKNWILLLCFLVPAFCMFRLLGRLCQYITCSELQVLGVLRVQLLKVQLLNKWEEMFSLINRVKFSLFGTILPFLIRNVNPLLFWTKEYLSLIIRNCSGTWFSNPRKNYEKFYIEEKYSWRWLPKGIWRQKSFPSLFYRSPWVTLTSVHTRWVFPWLHAYKVVAHAE